MARRKNKQANGSGSLFKRGGVGKWIASYRDETGKRKTRTTGTTDKQTANRILAKWTADVALRKSGVIDTAAERVSLEGRRPLAEHIDDFEAHLQAKGNGPKYIAKTRRQVESMTQGMGQLADLTPARISAVINSMATAGRGIRSRNEYLIAVKGFARWAWHGGRLNSDPLASMKRLNQDSDRRRVRRPLTAAELAYLLRAVEAAPQWRTFEAHDRAMLYRVAAGTGFRASELRSLRVSDFDLEAPAVTVRAAYSKRRRDDRQPIRRDLADRLREYLAGKRGSDSALHVHDRTAEALRFDLRLARIAWRREAGTWAERRQRAASGFLRHTDSEGRQVDFHALRATYVTLLVKSGATVKQAQTLARHSDPKLTLNTYTTLGISDVTSALDAMPSLEQQQQVDAVAMATGTDDSNAVAARSAYNSNGNAKHSNRVQSLAANVENKPQPWQLRISDKTKEKRNDMQGNADRCANGGGRIRTRDRAIMSRLL